MFQEQEDHGSMVVAGGVVYGTESRRIHLVNVGAVGNERLGDFDVAHCRRYVQW